MSKMYIVGTPIGNLEDITLRALSILKKVDIIACEDTRVTSKLLKYYQIENKKLITYNNFTEKNSSKGILNLLQSNDSLSIALVSDAGMPVISDPGFQIIKMCRDYNIDFEIVPGVSASITAFVGSSFSHPFTFLGFLKDKSIQRINQLKELTIGTYVFFVSPHKLINSLKDIHFVFQEQIQLCLAKELTKIHERWFYGTAQEILNILEKENLVRGEFTLVLNLPKVKRTKINKYKKN
ncbi:16S rRNA (cytidine(1402)-2'-O)-methyltransferase [Mycoplasmopsis cricetuli]|uniref:16S rRNA (cytidine(1402)-2'-O)-methyltransferase n=1 Tax=Mycoplasmopsis cricetuli TaxID=171283 RepID=UPI00046FF0C3|nr:16S rRNA (cytidine(1402)-2'-O)-methyltransferase [Mycoplasmopsis cricetuli]